MRRTLQLLIAPLLIIGFSFVLGSVVQAQAESTTLTEDQEDRISANCVTIKNTVNQLHVSDALLRVNRGQIYESMGTNLMDKFNDRLGNNSLDNKAMLNVTGSYRTALATFRTNYISYEQKMTEALRIDCTSKPAEFYRVLESARKLRATVHGDVKKLHELIDDYRSSVGGFLVNYERSAE